MQLYPPCTGGRHCCEQLQALEGAEIQPAECKAAAILRHLSGGPEGGLLGTRLLKGLEPEPLMNPPSILESLACDKSW